MIKKRICFYRAATLAIALIAMFAFTLCTKPKASYNLSEPLDVTFFPWGSSKASVKKVFANAQWEEIASASGDELKFQLPQTLTQETQKLVNIKGDEILNPYRITCYFNNDKLAIVKILRTDAEEQIDTFNKNTLRVYSVNEPIFSSPEKKSKTPEGNEITESARLFKSGAFYIQMVTVKVKVQEEKLKKMISDEAEIRIYSIPENEGITSEALIESIKKM